MFEKIGMTELLLVAGVALLFFGPAKLPQLGKSLGEGIREFRGAFRSMAEEPQEKKS